VKRHGVLVASLLVACGGNTASDDAPPGDGASCSAACVMQGWWIGVSSNCDVVCMADPTLTECMQADCEVIEASRFEDMRKSLAPMLHSAQARSFYLIGSLMTTTYAVDASCQLQIGTAMPKPFSCTSTMLTLQTAILAAASAEQTTALDAAAAANTSGHYTY